ncbi:MAG: hypothetical protein ABJ360_19490 [Roseobacter sp.]
MSQSARPQEGEAQGVSGAHFETMKDQCRACFDQSCPDGIDAPDRSPTSC